MLVFMNTSTLHFAGADKVSASQEDAYVEI